VAICEYNKGLEIDDSYVYGYCMRGQAYFHKKSDECHNDYKKAIEIDGRCFLAFKIQGFAYYKTEEYAKAIDSYTKAINIKQNDFGIYYDRGMAYASRKEFDKAFDDFVISSYYKYNKPDTVKEIDIFKDWETYKDKLYYFPYFFRDFINSLTHVTQA
jgi:tetratricopeptide (TPR) repeat protein